MDLVSGNYLFLIKARMGAMINLTIGAHAIEHDPAEPRACSRIIGLKFKPEKNSVPAFTDHRIKNNTAKIRLSLLMAVFLGTNK